MMMLCSSLVSQAVTRFAPLDDELLVFVLLFVEVDVSGFESSLDSTDSSPLFILTSPYPVLDLR